jgi:hypothetical protein
VTPTALAQLAVLAQPLAEHRATLLAKLGASDGGTAKDLPVIMQAIFVVRKVMRSPAGSDGTRTYGLTWMNQREEEPYVLVKVAGLLSVAGLYEPSDAL